MSPRSLPTVLVALALGTATLVGCAAQDTPATRDAVASGRAGGSEGTSPGHSDHDHAEDTSASGMTMDMGSAGKPSAPAQMICEDEIGDAVRRTFDLSAQPVAEPSWSKEDRVFGCRYELPDGALLLSVQDALDPADGQRHYDALRAELPGATPLRGMENFGFPAFDTASGDVAFIKDGKTLLVDATELPDAALPDGFSRREVAYSVAAAVIACWSEE